MHLLCFSTLLAKAKQATYTASHLEAVSQTRPHRIMLELPRCCPNPLGPFCGSVFCSTFQYEMNQTTDPTVDG